ncbi:hypothetical protein H5410_021364, partial [Solanum commersonii]
TIVKSAKDSFKCPSEQRPLIRSCYHKSLSVDENEITAIKALESGVIFFILKPISQDDIHYLWEYTTLRKKKHTGK